MYKSLNQCQRLDGGGAVAKKGKGSSYERALCKKLSLWASKGKSDFLWWRSAGSGSLSTIKAKKGLKAAGQEGDLAAVHPYGAKVLEDITCEAKCGYGSVSPLDLIDIPDKNKTRIWEGFIDQCLRECEEAEKKYFWLIVKRDRRQETLTTTHDFFVQYYGLFGEIRVNHLISVYNGLRLVTVPLDYFLEWYDVETIHGPFEE